MHNQLEQIQEEKEGTQRQALNMVKLSCNMHPITQLTKPDFMESEKSSMIDTTCSILYAMLPMILNYFLNYASALINIYFAGITSNNKQTFAQICFGTVIANVCVFYLIEYVGAGFAIVCSYFSSRQKEEVGYLYQKTLGVTFLICVIMTPMIYLSDKLFTLLGYNHKLVQFACSYAWAIVPSFYLCSFIDTNKNYLMSQGVIFPPIVIHFFAATAHLFICLIYTYYSPLGLLGAAWIKNVTDCLCALSIYLFIIIKQPTKESWVEWSLKAANNIGRYLQQVFHSQAFTYIEVMSFQVLSIIACRMNTNEIDAHFSYAILYIIIYFCFNSLSQCVSRAIAISIEQNQVILCKKRISLGILLALLFAFILIINVIHYRAHFNEIFTDDPDVSIEIDSILHLFCIVVGVSALNVMMLGIVKTLQLQYIWNYSFVICYIIGIAVSITLCYVYDYGVWGLWIGWLISLVMELYMNLKRVICLDFQFAFSQIQDRYRIISNDIRASKMEMTFQNQSH